MTFWEKRDAAIDDLVRRGVKRSAAAPWLYRWLWAVGLPVRPPHYQTLAGLFLTHMPVFWPAMAVLAAAFTVTVVGLRAIPVAVVTAAAMAGGVGVMAALADRAEARRLRLPTWEAFDPYQPDPDADW